MPAFAYVRSAKIRPPGGGLAGPVADRRRDPGHRVTGLFSSLAAGALAGAARPSLGMRGEGHAGGLGNGYAGAYNNWLSDFQSVDRSRIVAACHLHLKDPEEALRELRRNLKRGFKAVFLPPERPLGKPFVHPDFAPIFRELEEAGAM